MYDYLAKIILLGPSGSGKYGSLLCAAMGIKVVDGILQVMSLAPLCQERMENSLFTDDRSRVCKQDHKSGYWCTTKADKATSGRSIPPFLKILADRRSSGTQQEPNDSAPSPAPTTEVLRALSSSTISHPTAPSPASPPS